MIKDLVIFLLNIYIPVYRSSITKIGLFYYFIKVIKYNKSIKSPTKNNLFITLYLLNFYVCFMTIRENFDLQLSKRLLLIDFIPYISINLIKTFNNNYYKIILFE